MLYLLLCLRYRKVFDFADHSNSIGKELLLSTKNWSAPIALFVYAAMFSFAYISLDTGVGALILFGAVQITIITVTLIKGHRLGLLEWVGMICAILGFIYLMAPSISATNSASESPISTISFLMMLISGIAWGLYTIMGSSSNDPLRDTTVNFLKTIPFVVGLSLVFLFQSYHLSVKGFVLAVLSGALASGLGYAIWYAALKGLSGIQAAVLQLLVPVIAAIGGVIFAQEVITTRFMFAAMVILGGILLVTLSRQRSLR